jgi:hypothetical protein
VNELAADGIPVAVTCRVLNIARQPYYRWLTRPVTDAELAEAYRGTADLPLGPPGARHCKRIVGGRIMRGAHQGGSATRYRSYFRFLGTPAIRHRRRGSGEAIQREGNVE